MVVTVMVAYCKIFSIESRGSKYYFGVVFLVLYSDEINLLL